MIFDDLLSHLETDINISDILITEGSSFSLRRNGEIEHAGEHGMIDSMQMDQIIGHICEQNSLIRDGRNELDLGFHSGGGFYYRINIFLKSGLRALAIRKITNSNLELEDIMTAQLAQTIKNKILHQKSGLFLVTGTAGSGKSTTLMACLEYINKNFKKHIITIEDPIEYVYKNNLSILSQRQVGRDTATFATGLKSLLRQNPDVILVGEIRDPESAEAVINIAETGHLVLSTLHTKAAINTVSRLISFFPPYYQDSIKDRFADVFLGSLAQRLDKMSDNPISNDTNQRMLANKFARVASFELMLNNTAISNVIRKGDFKQIPSLIQTAKQDGMISLEEYRKLIQIVDNK